MSERNIWVNIHPSERRLRNINMICGCKPSETKWVYRVPLLDKLRTKLHKLNVLVWIDVFVRIDMWERGRSTKAKRIVECISVDNSEMFYLLKYDQIYYANFLSIIGCNEKKKIDFRSCDELPRRIKGLIRFDKLSLPNMRCKKV